MPRVPQQDNFQTSINTSRGPAFQGSTGPQAGQVAAQQIEQAGEAVGRVGDVASKITLDIQQETNRVRVIDAVNRAKESAFDLQSGQQGFKTLKGYNALNRPDGKSLVDEYDSKLSDSLGLIEKDLSNDAQKAMFRENAAAMRTQMRGQLNEHTLSEFRNYQGSVYDGAAQTAKRQIELNYNRTEPGGMIDQAIDTIKASVYEKARLTGVSMEMADNVARREISGAHRLALRTALERNDVSFADGYLKKYRDSMEADDILAVQGTITKEMDQRQAFAAASTAVTMVAPKLAPTEWDRVLNITMATESNGRRYGPDGKTLLTSPKGARGEMQVMPGTQKDPGFGVKPARDDSPEELARVGRDYLAAMLKRYEGDLGKAWAAYNGGPGALDKAIMRADASRTPGADWLTFMPAESQAYVTKNMKALQSGQGAPVATLADVQDQVRRTLGPDAKPNVIKAAEDEAERRWNDQVKARRDQEDGLVAEAQRSLLANGGDFGALSANLRAAMPAGKVPELMNFADKLRKGQEAQTNMSLYQRLSDPKNLASLTDSEFFMLKVELSDADFKHFANERQKIKSGPKANDPGQLDSGAIKATLDNRLSQIGIETTPKDGSDEAGRVGAIRAFVNASIANTQMTTGKRFNDVEISQHIDGLFAKSLTFKKTVLGFKADDVKNQMLTMKLSDIPEGTVDKLKADFMAQGISDPTEGQILGAYWTLKAIQGKKP